MQCGKTAPRWASHCVTDSHLKGAAHSAPGVSADQHWSGTATFLALDTVLECSIRWPPLVGTDIMSLPHTEFASVLFFPEAAGFLTSFSSSMANCLRSLCILQLSSSQSVSCVWGGTPGTAALRKAGRGRTWVEAAGLQKEFQHRSWLKNKAERTKERKQHKTKPYLQDLGNWFRIFITFSFLSVKAISQGCYQDYSR